MPGALDCAATSVYPDSDGEPLPTDRTEPRLSISRNQRLACQGSRSASKAAQRPTLRSHASIERRITSAYKC